MGENIKNLLNGWLKSNWVKNTLSTWFLLPVILYLGIHLLSVFGLFRIPAMHLSRTNWKHVIALLKTHHTPPVLLIHMANEPPGWDIAYERLLSIDPASGKVLGQIVMGGWMYLIGVTGKEVWLTTRFPGKSVSGYALPDLDCIYKQDALLADHPDIEKIIKTIHVDGPQADLRI